MGNRTGNVTSVDFNPKEWQLSEKQTSQNESKGNFKVLQNMKSGELIDEYQLFWPSEEDFRFYLDSYYWRRQEYNIVPSKYIVEQHSDQFCSRSYGAKVYIEHIQTRLSDVTDIPFPDNLYVALAVLEGYQKLYENVHHYFPISEDQICVDREGVVKVWVNSDLSKNYPEPEEATSESKDEAHMVEELLNIVWQNTDQESQPQSFRNVSCQIPEKFNSILQMIEQSQYQENQREEYEDNDNQLRNIQDPNHFQHQGDYGYHNVNNHLNGFTANDRQEGYEGEYGDDVGQIQDQYYHQGNFQQGGNVMHQLQNVIREQSGGYYQNASMPIPYYNSTMAVPQYQPVNPFFTPIQYRPHTGPLISIPPLRANVTHINSQPLIMNPYNNVGGYNQTYQGGQQHVQYNQGQNVFKQQPVQNSDFNNNNNTNNDRELNQEYGQHQGYRMQPLSNTNNQFEQHISTLNPQSGHSSQHAYHPENQYNESQEHEQKYVSYASRQEINGSVGRSLQLIAKESKNSQQNEARVNKSHINELGQGVQVSYPRHYEDHLNSRVSGATGSRMGESSGDRTGHQLQHIKQELMDTKYYTLDTQIQLDEQIAADLKKMIMAL